MKEGLKPSLATTVAKASERVIADPLAGVDGDWDDVGWLFASLTQKRLGGVKGTFCLPYVLGAPYTWHVMSCSFGAVCVFDAKALGGCQGDVLFAIQSLVHPTLGCDELYFLSFGWREGTVCCALLMEEGLKPSSAKTHAKASRRLSG